MTAKHPAPRQSAADTTPQRSEERPAGPGKAPEWREEWLPLAGIVRLEAFQVRKGLDAGAVRHYRDLTATGHALPPIKVARVQGKAGPMLYLVDGWHRMEAGALQQSNDFEGPTVLALVADMSEAQARWEAARANLGNGVPLKRSEHRAVFKAFIQAGMHRKGKGRGEVMSYRELSEAIAIGRSYTTIRNWTMRDFPALARSMSGPDNDHHRGGMPEGHIEAMSEVHRREALAALQDIRAGASALTPAGRHAVALELLALAQALEDLGAEPDAIEGEF